MTKTVCDFGEAHPSPERGPPTRLARRDKQGKKRDRVDYKRSLTWRPGCVHHWYIHYTSLSGSEYFRQFVKQYQA